MRITQVEIKDFKGIAGHAIQPLHGLDLLVGENGSGKSTRLKAVTYALVGSVPGEGELPKAIYSASSRSEESMSVGLQFDGFEFTRSLVKKGEAVNQKISINGKNEPVTAANSTLNEKVGNFPVMFNIGEFTGLSADKKKEFIFDLAKSESVDEIKAFEAIKYGFFKQALGDDIVNSILEYVFDGSQLDQLNDQQKVEFFGECELKLPSGQAASSPYNRMIDNLEMAQFGSLQDYLVDIIGRVKDIASVARSDKKEADGASTSLLELKQSGEATAKPLVDLQEDLGVTEGTLKDARERQSTNQERIRNNTIRTERIAELKETLSADAPHIDIKSAEDMLTAATKLENQHNKNLQKSIESARVAESDLATARNALNTAKANFDKATENYEKMQKIGSSGITCPIDEELKCPVDWSERINALNVTRSLTEKALKTIQDEFDIAFAKSKQADHDRETNIEARSESEAAIRHIGNELEKKKNQLELQKERRAGHQKELAKYQSEENKDEQTVDPQMLTNEIVGLEEKERVIKAQISNAERNKTMLISINASIEKGDEADETLNLCKHMEAGIKGVRDLFLVDQLAPVTERINELLKLIDSTFEFQMITDGKEFHMGWAKNQGTEQAEFIPFSSLSGGEGVLFTTAFIGAVLALKDIPCKVLCVEASEVGPSYMPALLTGLGKMEALIDNVIVAHCYYASQAPEGWTVTNL